MPVTSDNDIRALFDAETVTVVGCSATAGRPAYDIPAYIQHHSCRITLIDPFHDEIPGETAHDSLANMDGDVNLVDVFRLSGETGDIVDVAIERAADRGDVKAVWLQLGIRDDDAAARTEEAGLSFVQGKCFEVEHSRLI